MDALIGDIGNTVTKICLVKINNYKVRKIIYLESKNILSIKYLKKKLNKVLQNKKINKIALFSSVVPKYQFILKKFLNKTYKIKLREIKENHLHHLDLRLTKLETSLSVGWKAVIFGAGIPAIISAILSAIQILK